MGRSPQTSGPTEEWRLRVARSFVGLLAGAVGASVAAFLGIVGSVTICIGSEERHSRIGSLQYQVCDLGPSYTVVVFWPLVALIAAGSALVVASRRRSDRVAGWTFAAPLAMVVLLLIALAALPAS